MGRREKPLDPDDGPVRSFAHGLRELRRAAGGPTYRAMATGSGYSAPTLSAAASGERLPSLPVALAYVTACGGDRELWEKRWHEAVSEDPVPVGGDDTAAPYPGLARYGREDRDHFFGRAELVAELLELTRRGPFAALVGASGSGKSSLLRAGLVPALQEEEGAVPAVIRILTPGPAPARTHRGLFTPGALLLVDQFEEVFTLCRDPAERSAFIALLTGPDTRAVIAVRADFYGRCAEHPALVAALKGAVLLVGPMTAEQLRSAVVGPASAGRLIVERALTARIVADVAGEPGGLPLMSHALLETWRRRRGRTLTEAAYEAIGGVQGAIAHTAEEVFAEFTEEEARAARALLLRLISPGDATEDTRRPAARAELVRDPASARVLERLVRARLLTVDDTSVNLAHEALITGWPRLRGWVGDDRELLRTHRRLTDAARMWAELGRDPGALYRGAQLETAREAFHVKHAGLTAEEGEFLDASVRASDAERLASARTARRLRGLTVTLSLLLCLAVIAGIAAWHQSGESGRRATEADARRLAGVADTMRVSDPYTATWLSLASWRIADLPETREALFAAAAQPDTDVYTPITPEFEPEDNTVWTRFGQDGTTLVRVGPDRTDRWDVGSEGPLEDLPGLGKHAKRIVDISPDARTVAVATPGGIRLRDLEAAGMGPAFGPGGEGVSGWFTPGGRVFASHTPGGGLQLWDTATGRELLGIADGSAELSRVQVSPDDRLLAYCPERGPLRLWDVRERRRLPTPWLGEAVPESGACVESELLFTPDSRALAFNSPTGIRSWEVRSGRERPRIETDGTPDMAFSSDGTHVATLTKETVQLWRTDAPDAPVLQVPAHGAALHDLRLDLAAGIIRYASGTEPGLTLRTIAFDAPTPTERERIPLTGAAFGPDGRTLATTRAGVLELRDADGKQRRRLPAPKSCDGCGPTIAFQPDGPRFAHLDAKNRVVVRNLYTGDAETTLPPRPGIDSLALSRGGRDVAVSRSSLSFKALDSADLRPGPGRGRWEQLRRSGDGRVLATAPDGSYFTEYRQLIDPRDGSARRVMRGQGAATAAAFSEDGRFMAMGDWEGRITLWDGEGRTLLAVLVPGERRGPASRPPALAFSPDSRTLAVGDAHGGVRLWDTASPRSQGSPLPRAGGPVLALSFVPGPGRQELRVTTPHVASRAYSLSARHAAGTICERIRTGLPEPEWEFYLPAVPYRPTCP
ncbi:hypothetical protein GCM10010232_64510 [Streptomyces amakusaensis]|uniref:HTH cro/C1-type domain-containing protein n=1 Tax=Streptomyces amakusaensis TaxID=67271 RepID=A0ABW0AR62_9ACTN